MTDEELELNSYLGTEFAQSLLPKVSTEVVTQIWRSGFRTGAQCMQEMDKRAMFRGPVIVEEIEGPFMGHPVYLSVTHVDGTTYITNCLNMTDGEPFNAKLLSPHTLGKLREIFSAFQSEE